MLVERGLGGGLQLIGVGAGRLQDPDQGDGLVAAGLLDQGRLAQVLGAQHGGEAVGLGVDAALPTGALERGADLGFGQLGRSARGRGDGRQGAGLGTQQSAGFLGEGGQDRREVLAQQRAQLVVRMGAVSHRVDGIALLARDAAVHPRRRGAEHIPAFLPAGWYERHFEPLEEVNPMLIRRTEVPRLVRMVAGGSLAEAAGLLGTAATDTTWQGRIYSGAGQVHSRAKARPNPLAFDTALRALAAELDEPDTPLTNYRQRRGALQAWAIDDDTWEGIVSRLPPVPGPHRPELGDRKRQIASIYVRVRITSGEHLFAPKPIEDAQPPTCRKPGSFAAIRSGTSCEAPPPTPSPRRPQSRTQHPRLLARTSDRL